ncbi:hypothetical protein [Kutzneria albida]|nr:hypothetical protein [Kutzneria albida]
MRGPERILLRGPALWHDQDVLRPLLTWRDRVIDLALVSSCACTRSRRGG